MANITIKQLRALVETCRAGKLALAAERLHVTPSALSMLIRQLEDELGVRLFERGARRLLPTETARHSLDIAERMLADLQRLQDGARDFHALGQGRLSVAATPALVAQLLPRAVMRFRAQYPGIEVAIDDCAPDALWPLVSNGHSDLGVGSPDVIDKSLEWDVLARDKICLLCRHDDPLAGQRSHPWAVLREHAFITVKRASGIRRLIDQTLLRLGLNVEPALELNYLESVLALTQAGLAIAVLPSFFVRGSAHGAGLAVRPLSRPSVKRDILLLRRRGRELPPAAQRFREVLIEAAAEPADGITPAACPR